MNSQIMCDYIRNVLAPCFPANERKLLIMDAAPGHRTDAVKQVCKELRFDIAMIPGGMTRYLQPLDIAVNRSFKCNLKKLYIKELRSGQHAVPRGKMAKVRLGMIVKQVGEAASLVSRECISNGFRKMWEYAGF